VIIGTVAEVADENSVDRSQLCGGFGFAGFLGLGRVVNGSMSEDLHDLREMLCNFGCRHALATIRLSESFNRLRQDHDTFNRPLLSLNSESDILSELLSTFQNEAPELPKKNKLTQQLSRKRGSDKFNQHEIAGFGQRRSAHPVRVSTALPNSGAARIRPRRRRHSSTKGVVTARPVVASPGRKARDRSSSPHLKRAKVVRGTGTASRRIPKAIV
jgi:hypothetical protein